MIDTAKLRKLREGFDQRLFFFSEDDEDGYPVHRLAFIDDDLAQDDWQIACEAMGDDGWEKIFLANLAAIYNVFPSLLKEIDRLQILEKQIHDN